MSAPKFKPRRRAVFRPPDKPARNDTPAERLTRAGADSGYNGVGDANCKAEQDGGQAWQRGLPDSLIALVRLHRLHSPGAPLPPFVQQAVGAAWGRL